MKVFILFSSLLFTTQVFSKVLFQPRLDHKGGHELVWTFSKAPENWGKNDPSQVKIECGEVIPEYDVKWSNGQTLKVVFHKNLRPGLQCFTHLSLEGIKEKNAFKVPLIKILNIQPWDFEKLEEDNAFILSVESPIDPEALAGEAYVEVEGLSEKIELDAVTGESKKALLKSQWMEDSPNIIVLKPRRNFPLQKSIVLVVPEKFTFELKKQGKIRDPFRARMTCERTNDSAPCSPLSSITLEFNSQVKYSDLRGIRMNQGKSSFALNLPEGEGFTSYASFQAPLEAEAEYKIELPQRLMDADGRDLSNFDKFPLTLKTSSFPPLAKFPGPFGILEAAIEPVLPVTVRNIEKEVRLKKSTAVISVRNPLLVMQWQKAIADRQYMGFEKDLRGTSVFAGSPIKLSEETLTYGALKNQMEVLGLPLKQKGLHLIELSSDDLGTSLLASKKKFYISTAVLVTDLVVHLKLGASNTLVWVTGLNQGLPVAGAQVILHDCQGKNLAKGETNIDGVIIFPNVTSENLNCISKTSNFSGKIMATAMKGGDSTFTLSDWSEGIEPWRFNINWYNSEGSRRAHTVFDRPVYKNGENIHMLHLLRDQMDKGLILSGKQPTHLRISHYETSKEWKLPLKWKKLGQASTDFIVPETAPQGNYSVSLISFDKQGKISDSLDAGSFRVKEFRVPLMRAEVNFQDQRESYLQGEVLRLLGHLEFLAGGASSDTMVTLRAEVSTLPRMSFKEWEDFDFRPGKAGEYTEPSGTVLDKTNVVTDKNGDFAFELKGLSGSERAQTLFAEVEYLDPNGTYQTGTASTTLYPHDSLIGVMPPSVIEYKKITEFKIAIIDLKQRPLKRPFKARLMREITTSTRKKILGGFYSYDSTRRMENAGEVCSGQTQANGIGLCKFTISNTGHQFLQVESGQAVGHTSFYVYGDNTWSPQTYHDRLDMMADKKAYEAGDVARYELKLPFEKGKVLVSKERAGVRKAWVTNYSRKDPFISVPVEKDDYPNTFVSVLVIRGRLAGAQATGMVDLGKPAYRLGLTEMRVSAKDHDLKLNITPEKELYQVRDRVRVKLKVASADGSPSKNTKVALSVFDEGLLYFGDQSSFDPTTSLIRFFPHQISNATAQTHVIGKRHFGLKARPQGGGGGRDLKPRELFDTLLYWKPDIDLDAKGEAWIDFPLNDSITSFKIYGLAYTTDRFGLNNTQIKATQDIMTFVGTSPSVRTGDSFLASYTLKNITSQKKNLKIVLNINGKTIKEEELTVPGGSSHLLNHRMEPFTDPGNAKYSLSVFEGKKKIDEIKTGQKIVPLIRPEVRFSDLKEIALEAIVPAQKDDALVEVALNFSRTLLPGEGPLREYMLAYSYNCLEQEFARAVILEDKKLKQKIEGDLPNFIDNRGLLKFYPSDNDKGYLFLTSHILEASHWTGWELQRGRELEAALGRFVRGETKDLQNWEEKNFRELKLKAMVTLKLRDSKEFNPNWVSDVPLPAESDDLSTLMDKWVLFHPGVEASRSHEFIRQKLKIEGSLITLISGGNEENFFYAPAPSVFARFLLLQKTLPLKDEFSAFYKENEGKFVRGFVGLRRGGHFGETMSNTMAFILQKKWKRSSVTGTTTVAGKSAAWKKDEDPQFLLTKEEAAKDQFISHKGEGSPWVDIRYFYRPDTRKGLFQGIVLTQSLKKMEGSGDFEVQDRLEATITIELKDDQRLLGMRVPLPAGVSILNSSMEEGHHLNFEERTELEWRGYFSWLPKGKHIIKLVFRLNQTGNFGIPGTRMEALYSPEVFGQLPYWSMKVK